MGGVPVLLMVVLFSVANARHPDDRCVVPETIRVYAGGSLESSLPELEHRSFGGCNRQIPERPFDIDFASRSDRLHTAVVLVSDTFVVPDTFVTERFDGRSSAIGAATKQKTSDFTAVEIPQIRSVSSERCLNPATNSRSVTVWKPENTTPAASGFSFPSVPPSLAGSAQTLAPNVDRAGRTIDPVASALGAVNGSTLPSTGTSTAQPFTAQPFTAPPFTNSGGTPGVVASGVNGPSTNPRTNRGTAWGQVPELGTTTSSPAGTSLTRNSNPNQLGPATNRTSSGTVASPILATDTFGRTPSGLNALPASRSSQPNYGFNGQPAANSGTPNFVHVPTTGSIFGGNNSASSSNSSNVGPGSVAAAPAYGATAPRTQGQASSSFPVGPPPMGRFGVNPSMPFTQPSASGYPASTANTGTSATPGFPNSQPDARLSAAQIAAGAWSVDAFGQPVDRAGQRIASAPATTGNSVANTDYQPNIWRSQPSTYPPANAAPINDRLSHRDGQRPPSGIGSHLASQSGNNFTSGHTNATNRGTAAISAPASKPANSMAALESPPFVDPLAASKRSSPSMAPNGQPTPQAGQMAAQPLFNGLLLISIVANIYLIFWLKNLRLQYHDMVAAKRMANSNVSSN